MTSLRRVVSSLLACVFSLPPDFRGEQSQAVWALVKGVLAATQTPPLASLSFSPCEFMLCSWTMAKLGQLLGSCSPRSGWTLRLVIYQLSLVDSNMAPRVSRSGQLRTERSTEGWGACVVT